jgi:5-methylcytosine-specific restriction endonuclease McrA
VPYKDPAKATARRRNREHIRRVTVSDITAEQELELRRRTRKCPLCGVWMTSKPWQPNSKELDHILPVNQGGTHTHGNVRIICRKCNLSRPKDGSDYTGPLTLWAHDPAAVSRPDRRLGSVRGTCRKGLHPWVPENVRALPDGKRRCRVCEVECWRRMRGTTLAECRCGAAFPAAGRTFLCPVCTTAAGHRAAELHSGGLTWQQAADQVGYTTAEGARFAAKRAVTASEGGCRR